MLTEALWTHVFVVSFLLTAFGGYAVARGLVYPTSTLAWSLATFAIYFAVNPAVAVVAGHAEMYHWILRISGGIHRAHWILFVVSIGVVAYLFSSALASRGVRPTGLLLARNWRYGNGVPPGSSVILVGSLAASIYSLVAYRGAFGLASAGRDVDEWGRFVGNTTGFEVSMHQFAIVPILTLAQIRKYRVLGWILYAGYVGARLYDPWDRASIVSLTIAMFFVFLSYGRSDLSERWARLSQGRRRVVAMVVGGLVVVALTVFLQLRGHESIGDGSRMEAERASMGYVAAGPDTSMLATFYLRSYLNEREGWTYGSVLLTRVLFGALPRRWFPWKDDFADFLVPGRVRFSVGDELVHTLKGSVLSSLYRIGGWIAVFLGMLVLGRASVLLEVMVDPTAAVPVRALGMAWIAMIWIMLGSSIEWCMGQMLMIGAPGAMMILLHVTLRWFSGQFGEWKHSGG